MLRSDRCLPERLAGNATSKKPTVKPMTCRLFAKRCFPSVFFIFSVHTAGYVGFRPLKQQLHKWLIIVGWVEVQNPT